MVGFNTDDLAIQLGDKILVTGTTGYVGSHVADQILAAGYQVRGLVRSFYKSQWLQGVFDEKYGPGRYERIEVGDVSQDGAYDEAVKGVSGVVHVATIMPLSSEPDPYIPQVVALTMDILQAAAKVDSVKRVVITSSSMSAVDPDPDTERTVTVSTWNEKAMTEAWKPPFGPQNMWSVYGASKALAEKTAWEWVAENKPQFVLNAILPNTNFGPAISRRHQGFGSTDDMLKQVFDGNSDPMSEDSPQYFVDVRDTARLHLIALVAPQVQGERLFAFAEPYNWNMVLKIFRKLYPVRKFPADLPNLGMDISSYPRERATALLASFGQSKWISLEESIRDTLSGL